MCIALNMTKNENSIIGRVAASGDCMHGAWLMVAIVQCTYCCAPMGNSRRQLCAALQLFYCHILEFEAQKFQIMDVSS